MIDSDRLNEIELSPRDAYLFKAEAKALVDAYREVQRLREALHLLLDKCDDSDDAQYGTLGTEFVRDIARRALEGGE